MAVYAVGDIHGCYDELRQLLDLISFDPNTDQLWAVGDLINRGPKSCQVLRYLYDLGDACHCVLGNHDLSFLLWSANKNRPHDAFFSPIMQSKDADKLCHWLRHRPLFYQDATHAWCMVHASIHPNWSFEQTRCYAQTLEAILRSDDWHAFLMQAWQQNTPNIEPKVGSDAHLFFCLDIFVRARYCSSQYEFHWHKADQLNTKIPWFSLREKSHQRIVYGHWAEMGLVEDQAHVLGLDSGCVWGGKLTAARLDQASRPLTQVQSLQQTFKP
ncbi:MAG: symmetrical bis(5'-nucleosyl)-tetraphosphatase [Mariprofundaceae bacterium]|nr:symmetrical bis(5'-nucleosyl)-tetraphosphatase [Mariprofundaceae bacterium]